MPITDSSPSSETPGPEYLAEAVPPCTPVEGISVEPCTGISPWVGSTLTHFLHFDAQPRDLAWFLGYNTGVWVSHLVIRGTYLPNTARCFVDNQDHSPTYLNFGSSNYGSPEINRIKCYADVRVNEYLIGSGPSTLTLRVARPFYGIPMTDAEVKEEFAALESALAGGAPHWQLEVPEGGIIGVESILFIGPSYDVTEESLLAINAWGLRTKDDGTVVAVHPYKTYWDYRIAHDDVVIDPSVLEMDLPTFRTRLTAAHQARLSAEGGLRSLPEYPPLMTDANRLRQFLVEAGALDNPGFPLKAIPPACGLAVPNQTDNPGLMRDCMALLAAKDTLRGTATLDWSTGDSIGDWEGISTGGTPTRVIKLELPNDNLSGSIPAGLGDLAELTHLDLSSNSLTGDIPSELGGLSDLESIKLSGNSLTGCIPPALKDVTTNDLSSLDLFYCAPSPENLTAAATGDTSMVLSWDAVSNTSKYRVEYIRPRDDDWTVDNDTIATTTHTVEGLTCDSPYYFRVSAYGDGVTYAAAWSVPSVVATETTGTCVPPVFGASSYSFTIPDDTAIGESVGTVSATHPDGDTVSYSITSGNEDGKFGIDDSTGAITVSGTLDYSTTKSYTLIVKAGVERRGAVSIAVSISVLQTCSSGIAVADPDNNPGMVSDCKILLGARDALAGTATLDWSVNTSIGDWEGITTGDTPSRVTGLNLESQGLTGSIPPELAQLTNLEELLLSFNRLTGDIPAELGGLTNLTKLHLRYNDLTGEIPPELGNLSNLTELWLHSNQLTGPIPPELGSLSDLVWLGVSYNLLTGPIPPELGGLTELEWLWLHNNQLTGTIPWQLGTLSNLTTLEIASNQLEGCIPSALRRVRTNDLHRLGLSNCTEVGAVPAPGGVSASLAEGTFTITWSPVSGAGRYEVQYVIRGSGEDWAGVETTTVTSLTFSPEGGPRLRLDPPVQGTGLRGRRYLRGRLGVAFGHRLGGHRGVQPGSGVRQCPLRLLSL